MLPPSWPIIHHAANRTHELETLGIELGTEAMGLFVLLSLCIGIICRVASRQPAQRDGAGQHALIPATDDIEKSASSKRGSKKKGSKKASSNGFIGSKPNDHGDDSDDWEDLQLAREEEARREATALKMREADPDGDLPPNALRLSHRAPRAQSAIGEAILFGRNAAAIHQSRPATGGEIVLFGRNGHKKGRNAAAARSSPSGSEVVVFGRKKGESSCSSFRPTWQDGM